MNVLGSKGARAHARSRRALILCAMTAVAALCASMASAGPASAGGGKVTVVASGLDNARGLAWGAGGGLYVGEAGHGGSECIPGGPTGGTNCVGFTSGISENDKSGAHKIV